MAIKQTAIKVRLTKAGDEYWEGHSVHKVEENSGVMQLAEALYGTLMTGTSGRVAPRCFRVDIDLEAFDDSSARVTAWYKTRRDPERAVVQLEFVAKSREVTKDLDGNVIVGPHFGNETTGLVPTDPDLDPAGELGAPIDETALENAAGINFWKIIRGTNVIQEGRARIRLKAAYEHGGMSAATIGEIMHLQGKVNSTDMPHFGDFRRGQLLLLAAPHTKQWDESGLWYVDYVFEVSPIFPKTWNQWTQKQLFTTVTVLAPRFETAVVGGNLQAITGGFRDVEFDLPRQMSIKADDNTFVLSPTNTGSRSTRLYDEANFGFLDVLVQWERE